MTRLDLELKPSAALFPYRSVKLCSLMCLSRLGIWMNGGFEVWRHVVQFCFARHACGVASVDRGNWRPLHAQVSDGLDFTEFIGKYGGNDSPWVN
jgi:hypothetical protein